MEPSPRSNQSEKPSQPDDISGQLNRLKLTNDPREILKSFLGRTLRIVITDGRVIFGDFVCTDRDANIILENSLEYISEEVGKSIISSKFVEINLTIKKFANDQITSQYRRKIRTKSLGTSPN